MILAPLPSPTHNHVVWDFQVEHRGGGKGNVTPPPTAGEISFTTLHSPPITLTQGLVNGGSNVNNNLIIIAAPKYGEGRFWRGNLVKSAHHSRASSNVLNEDARHDIVTAKSREAGTSLRVHYF